MKTKQAKKNITRIYLKKMKQIYQKFGKPFALLSKWEEKVNVLDAPENITTSETFNFFFTNIGTNIAKRIPKGRKSPMTYLNDKILKSFFFYPTTPDKTIKIIKSFFNNKSASPNSLPTPILKNCADALSFPISYLVNLSFTTREFTNLCKIAKVIPLFKKGDPLHCSNY